MSPWRRVYREVDAAASRDDHAEGPARRALVLGMFLSGACLLLGLALMLLRHEARPDEPLSLASMIRGVAALHGVSLLYLGLLLLSFTPMLRVLVMSAVYLQHRQWFMLWVSLIVLGLLLVSLTIGAG